MDIIKDRIQIVVTYITRILAISMTSYHIYTSIFGLRPPLMHRAIHIGFIAIIIFLESAVNKDKSLPFIFWNVILSVVSFISFLYVVVNYEKLIAHVASPRLFEIVIGSLIIILVILAVKRRLGWALTIIATFFIVYTFYGNYFPQSISHKGYQITRIVSQLTMNTEGIFGMVAGTSATYIFLFCLFGCILEASGSSEYFMDVATLITGKTKGGAAKMAALSSGLFGMISGSAVANVMTTGTFSIPLMKKTGYSSEFAGSVEAVSSTGGQLMPPIMGAAAFIIAETLGIPYIEVAKAALIPAILYYVAIIITIDLKARKENIGGISDEIDMTKLKEKVKKSSYLAIPLISLIIFMVFLKWSPMRSGIYSCGIAYFLSFLKKESRIGFRKLLDILSQTAYNTLDVGIICATAGIIIGTLSLTGLGLKFSGILIDISGGHLILLLILAAISGLILGMGMTTTTVYIILSVLVSPALVKMGIEPIAAHLYVFYFGILSNITPPVAMASFAASSLAKCNAFKLGMVAWRLGLVGYILPFMFVYGKELVFIGSGFSILKAFITATIGVFALSCSLERYCFKDLNNLQAFLMFSAALLLINTTFITDIIGLILISVAIGLNYTGSLSHSKQV